MFLLGLKFILGDNSTFSKGTQLFKLFQVRWGGGLRLVRHIHQFLDLFLELLKCRQLFLIKYHAVFVTCHIPRSATLFAATDERKLYEPFRPFVRLLKLNR